MEISDYVTGYDHPDKYISNGDNPFVKDGGEPTKVFLTDSSHWKCTNSTCMTFGADISKLKEDYSIFLKYCQTNHPHDFELWPELINTKNRKLISAIPAVCTHGETKYLAPLFNWESLIN